MTREEVYETLNGVFQDVFDDESIEVHDETTSDDIEDWDSLEHINLIAVRSTRADGKEKNGIYYGNSHLPSGHP